MIDDPLEAVDHLWCCRRDWDRGLCGADTTGDTIALVFDRVCPLCVEEAERRTKALGVPFPDPPHCPYDGRPCPPDEELERIIERHLGF